MDNSTHQARWILGPIFTVALCFTVIGIFLG